MLGKFSELLFKHLGRVEVRLLGQVKVWIVSGNNGVYIVVLSSTCVPGSLFLVSFNNLFLHVKFSELIFQKKVKSLL